MAIKEYVHGGGKDYQLWGNVGRFVMDRKVQELMGNCISSEPGDIWWVNLTHKSETKGFASAREMKNGTLYLRYFYSAEQNALGLSEEVLIKKAVNHAQDKGMSLVFTNWHKGSEVLTKMGFVAQPTKRKNFARWELKLGGGKHHEEPGL
ncbi:hypothetical protein [Halomonas sp. Mc5H-6]|uniref:hypothetical protein n=1 Tax=Halomonas sp. Mc5H-6 TaxID=2954500 RepID=UPI002096994C|nr:hypothetical protein [Halomonas sp. Mc5H-6]MCO7246383.1 hypothetical protein [Halomonas sp. Mc5H-6]